jgi:signal transduction histidine kinase
MQKRLGEMRIVLPVFIVTFLGLAALALLFIVGESRRAQVLAEYEADRVASTLLDAYRAQGVFEPSDLDKRVLGFALYGQTGEPLVSFGDVPSRLNADQTGPAFRYDRGRGTLSVARPLGGAGPQGMMRGMMQGALAGRGPRAGMGGTLLLSMDARAFYRTRGAYRAAAVLAPLAIAGLAAAFFQLLVSNNRYRRKVDQQETLARLGESARTLAHEIRNPLGSIRLQTGLLRKTLSAGVGSRELEIIEEETERLNVLARRVGDFLKSPGGVPERISLARFLRDLAARSPYPIRATAELPDVVVLFDPELLRSVIENLVRNAHESYENVESDRGADLTVTKESGRVVISVLDRGKGIPEELMEKVFDPFFTDKIQGSGIGLSLSRRFVEAAGGTLIIGARPGGGTEARITLPEEAAT